MDIMAQLEQFAIEAFESSCNVLEEIFSIDCATANRTNEIGVCVLISRLPKDSRCALRHGGPLKGCTSPKQMS